LAIKAYLLTDNELKGLFTAPAYSAPLLSDAPLLRYNLNLIYGYNIRFYFVGFIY